MKCRALLLLCSMAVLLGCRESSTEILVPPLTGYSMRLSHDEATLTVGDTIRLDAEIRYFINSRRVELPPDDSAFVSWSSQDPGIAEVDSVGLVTAVAPGETRIQALLQRIEPQHSFWQQTKITVLPSEP